MIAILPSHASSASGNRTCTKTSKHVGRNRIGGLSPRRASRRAALPPRSQRRIAGVGSPSADVAERVQRLLRLRWDMHLLGGGARRLERLPATRPFYLVVVQRSLEHGGGERR